MAKKILIIDDEKDVVEILKAILEHEGYETIEANDGREGIVRTKVELPDLVITDINMPGMDGFKVTAEIRKMPQTFAIPIIMLTSRNSEADHFKGLSLNVYAYLDKPCDLDELREVVKKALLLKSA
ncbi:MAG: response regulator [Candidatus Margulisiibacteriota bacterium]